MDTVWAAGLDGDDAAAYDRFVLGAPSGHFAQTRAWARVAERAGPCHVRYFVAKEAGRIVGTALVLRAAAGPVPLPLARVERGPVCGQASDVARVIGALARAARRRGVVHLTAMPYWNGAEASAVRQALRDAGFKDIQRGDGAHAVTLRLALDNEDGTSGGSHADAILAGGGRAQLRRLLREASRSGATVRLGDRADLDAHRRLVRERHEAHGGRGRSTAWYDVLWSAMLRGDGRGALFVCELDGAVVGTAIVLRHGPLATYAYGATSAGLARRPPPRQFSRSVLPLVAAIRWAKDQGCTQFDLGGVPSPDDPDPKRASIAHYKLHFSKIRVELVREHARFLWL